MATFNTFREASEFAFLTHQQVYKVGGVLCVMSEEERETAARYMGAAVPDCVDMMWDHPYTSRVSLVRTSML